MNNNEMGFEFLEEQKIEEVTLSGLQTMIQRMFEKRAEIEEIQKQEKKLNAELEELKDKVKVILDAHGRTSLDVPGYGNVYISKKKSVSFPKDPELAARTREWAEKNGYVDLLTINSQTLNSVYKELAAPFEEQGYVPPDLIPGVGEPKEYETVNMRKGK